MSDVGSAPWTRGGDWVNVVAGAFLAVSPPWVDGGILGAAGMVVIGVVIVRLALGSLATPGAVADEWVTAAAGVVAFLAPWLFSYAGHNSGAAWTSWLVGFVVLISALLTLPDSRAVFRRQHPA